VANLVYPELSYKIIGVLFKVHNELGPNLAEKHYQRSIAKEFTRQAINYREQQKIEILRNGLIGNQYADFLVDNKIVLEIKATPRFSRNNVIQVLKYLREADLELGLLVNFSRRELIYKRILKGFRPK